MYQKLILAALAVLVVFSECKKGPDDPFISLRSRKARVVGDWKMTKGSDVSTSNSTGGSSSYQSSSTTSYDGSTYTSVSDNTSGGVPTHTTQSGSYTLKLSFKKDGTFEYEETRDGDASSFKGTWNFTGNVGDHKKKEQIALHITSSTFSGSTSTTTGNQVDAIFNLKELRNKKMVITYEQSSTDTDTYDNRS